MSFTWCHANTQLLHAFRPWSGASLCGNVVRPREIQTYGVLQRCPDCEAATEPPTTADGRAFKLAPRPDTGWGLWVPPDWSDEVVAEQKRRGLVADGLPGPTFRAIENPDTAERK